MKSAPAHRQQLALDLLLTGKSATATVAHLAAHCDCSRRQSQRYVAAAYQLLKADIEKSGVDRVAQVSKIVHLLETCIERALVAKQFNAVVAASRELRELLGLAADR